MQFRLLFQQQKDGSYLCFVPSLPGCVVSGKDIDEATEMAYEVIPACLSIFQEEGIDLVDDSCIIEKYITLPSHSSLVLS